MTRSYMYLGIGRASRSLVPYLLVVGLFFIGSGLSPKERTQRGSSNNPYEMGKCDYFVSPLGLKWCPAPWNGADEMTHSKLRTLVSCSSTVNWANADNLKVSESITLATRRQTTTEYRRQRVEAMPLNPSKTSAQMNTWRGEPTLPSCVRQARDGYPQPPL